ncbi:hypothetical protein B0I35DRAFT_499444 [Stachybotrys elegans]|uniref:DNA (cytosine-5-)-methyltransferase n=1 Tax=Stachybotrys elegans TaxID=80388 RepID=A0A8K0WT16_9HYPO|nr:hypothetical protein B0I35DRAFT_499444 [Stachybotrys elegans]
MGPGAHLALPASRFPAPATLQRRVATLTTPSSQLRLASVHNDNQCPNHASFLDSMTIDAPAFKGVAMGPEADEEAFMDFWAHYQHPSPDISHFKGAYDLASPHSTTSETTLQDYVPDGKDEADPETSLDSLLDELIAELASPVQEPFPKAPPPVELSKPSTSSSIRVELPASTLLTPRSFYDPFDPGMPIKPEASALETLQAKSSPDTGASTPEIILDDFVVYQSSAHRPLEMCSLHHFNTKLGHSEYYFDGVLRSGDTKVYVCRVPIYALPIGNYNDVSKHTVRGQIWIQSDLTSNTDLYYKIGQPAREYARFYTPFLWVADLAKHFVDFIEIMGRKKRKVSIHHFQSIFGTWLRKTHCSAPAFLEWAAKHPSPDYRTSVVANMAFLYKEAVGVLGQRNASFHVIWSEAWDLDYYKYTVNPNPGPTIVTPYTYDCFKGLPCGDQLEAVELSAEAAALRNLVIGHRPRSPPTATHKSPPRPPSPHWTSEIKPGDTISTPRDTETAGTKWRRETASGFSDVDRWFALVLKVHRRQRKTHFDVIWYYRPVDTLCGLMKYPWDNELFLSTHCSCQEKSKICEDEVLAVHNVDFGGDHTTTSEFFCRQTYLFEERTWISLQSSHKTCKHVSPSPSLDYSPGATVLVHIDKETPFSEPCEVLTSFREGEKKFYRLRRLLSRRHVDPSVSARCNELVYTENLIETTKKRILGSCSVRFFRPSEDIPTPYDRDGVGNFFYITHRQVIQPDGSHAYLPFDDFPSSLRQGFDPRVEIKKLRGLDLFCGGGNFGRGLEDGGGIEMKWANDYDQVAIHTYMANTQNPEEFHPFLGSVDDLQRLAIQGRFSKQVPQIGDVDFISAGSPCPGFSRLTNDKETQQQRKNQSLVAAFASFVDLYRPKYAILENVPGIIQGRAGREQDVFSQLICAMVGLGYQTSVCVLDAYSCGSPQRRQRMFVTVAAPGYKLPERPALTHSHPAKVKNHSLGSLPNGQPVVERIMPAATPFKFVSAAEATADLPCLYDAKPDICVRFPDHRVHIGMTKTVRSRLACIPTRPYGIGFAQAWYGMERKRTKAGTSVLTPAERALFGGVNSTNHQATAPSSNCYSREFPDQPMVTVVTSPHPGDAKSGRVLHWSEPRVMSIMEGRRAQGFRDEEVILGLASRQYRIVGNSVAREVAVALGAVFRAAWAESQNQLPDAHQEAKEVGDIPGVEDALHLTGTKRRQNSVIVEIRAAKMAKKEETPPSIFIF